MRKIVTLLFITVSLTVAGQSPSFDTVYFWGGGSIYELITYGGDSIQLNGNVYRFSGTTPGNNWQTDGSFYIKPLPETKIIKYPYIPHWNSLINANVNAPVWFRADDNTLRAYINRPIVIDPGGGVNVLPDPDAIYTYNETASDVNFVLDSASKIGGCFTIRNSGVNSEITVSCVDGGIFDAAPGTATTTLTIKYGEWFTFCPDSVSGFSCFGFTKTNDLVYTKTESDDQFALKSSDSLFKYSVYSSGNNNVEVIASTKDITASLANSNELTLTVPDGTRLISAKARFQNLSTLKIFTSASDGNTSLADRWNPIIQAWREDTGQQLMGVTTTMDLSNHTKITVNGLINTTICQIRIAF